MEVTFPKSDSLRLQLLGPPRLVGSPLAAPVPRKNLALLAYLAVEKGRHSRESLSHFLWPGASTSSARHSLSQALYSIRRLGISLEADSKSIGELCLPSDARSFSEAAARYAWVDAASLYGGQFLAGFHLKLAQQFDQWLEQLRFRFEEEAIETLEQLVQEGNWVAAVGLGKTILEDSKSARAVHGYARALVQLGRPMDAEAILSAHFRHSAGKEEIHLSLPHLARDRQQTFSAASPFLFVGRRHLLQCLEIGWRQAVSGELACTVLLGDPGVGKTALIERLRRLVALRGGQSVAAVGYLAERQVAFGVAEQWLHSLGHKAVVDKEPVLGRISAASPSNITEDAHTDTGSGLSARIQMFGALARVFEEAARDRPLLLCLDDAHWADPVSIGFLHYLSRTRLPARIYIVMTSRYGAWSSVAARSWERCEVLEVAALDLDEIKEFVARAGVDRDSHELLQLTGGNAFLVSAFIHNREWRPPYSSTLSSVTEFVDQLTRQLNPEDQLVLAAASLVPGAAGTEALQELSELLPHQIQTSITRLLEQRFLVSTGRRYTARYPLIAEHCLKALGAGLEQQLRGRALRLFNEAEHGKPAVLAMQYDIVGQRDKARQAALVAAEASLQLYAFREAEFFLKLALGNAPTASEAALIRVRLSNLLLSTGRTSESVRILQVPQVDDLAEPVQGALEVQKSIAAIHERPHLSSIEHALQVAEGRQGQVKPLLLAKLLTSIGAVAHDLGLAKIAITAADRALSILETVRQGDLPARLAVRAAITIALNGSTERGLHILDAQQNRGELSPAARVACLVGRSSIGVFRGELLLAERGFLDALQLAEQFDLADYRFQILNNLGVCCTELGRYEEALSLLYQAQRLAEAGAPADGRVVLENLTLAYYEAAEYEQALGLCSRHPGFEDSGLATGRSWLSILSVKGLCLLQLGRISEAFECKTELDFDLQRFGYPSNNVSYFEIFRSKILRLSGDYSQAIANIQRSLAEAGSREFCCRARLHVELLRLILEAQPLRALREAVELRQVVANVGMRSIVDQADGLITRARVRLPAEDIRFTAPRSATRPQ